MPHANLWEPHGVVMEFWGVVSGDEFVTAAQDVAVDPEFDTLQFVIVDFRKVDAHTVGEAALQDVAAVRIGSHFTNPNVRIVIVTRDDLVAQLAQSAAVIPFVGSRAAKVFSTIIHARAWLAMQPVLSAFRRIAQ